MLLRNNLTKKVYKGPLKGIILDWSGTTCDKYVIAPAVVFYNVFKKHNVPITMGEAREPMGLRKDLHIKAITEIPSVKDKWFKQYGRYPDDNDVSNMFKDFVPMQLDCLDKYSDLIPGTEEAVKIFREKFNLKIGGTTGFTREMVNVLLKNTEKQNLMFDSFVAGDDIFEGAGARPKPFMLYENLIKLDLFPIESVVKVDDTIGGVGEGLNAGCWTIGLSRYSNYMNINTLEEENQLSEQEINIRHNHSKEKLKETGCHYVLDSISDIPDVLTDINNRLANGETP
tara:strand:- start:912 stop:1766 length:855 start_codon:yes stop_codon:yes gene_type:complete